MYEKLSQSGENAIWYEIREVLTEDQLGEILTEIEDVLAEYGSVRLLVYLPSLPYPDVTALDDGLDIWLRHSESIDRYSIVGVNAAPRTGLQNSRSCDQPDVRYYEQENIDAVWDWIENDRDDRTS